MKRGGPLKRYTRLRARSKTSKHARRERDWVYMAFVRSRPCIARLLVSTGFECDGPVQADHVGGRYGADADRRCVPMCQKHHEDRTGRVGGRGLFAGWSLERRREWGAKAIEDTLAEYGNDNERNGR